MSPTSFRAALPRVIPSLLSATLIIIPYSNGFVKRVRKVFLQQKQRMKTRLLTFFEPLPVKRTMKKQDFFAKSHSIPRVSKCPRILPLGRCQCSGLYATCSVSCPTLPACGEKHDLCQPFFIRFICVKLPMKKVFRNVGGIPVCFRTALRFPFDR